MNSSSFSCGQTSYQTVCVWSSLVVVHVCDRDLDVSSAMAQEKDPTCHRSTNRMIVSSTHGSGARGCVMAGVGTADVPAASATSYRAAVPSGVSSGMVW